MRRERSPGDSRRPRNPPEFHRYGHRARDRSLGRHRLGHLSGAGAPRRDAGAALPVGSRRGGGSPQQPGGHRPRAGAGGPGRACVDRALVARRHAPGPGGCAHQQCRHLSGPSAPGEQLRRMDPGLGAHAGGQPGRCRTPFLLRRAHHERTRAGENRQRLFARRLSWRARPHRPMPPARRDSMPSASPWRRRWRRTASDVFVVAPGWVATERVARAVRDPAVLRRSAARPRGQPPRRSRRSSATARSMRRPA